jgi:hypothetical protein
MKRKPHNYRERDVKLQRECGKICVGGEVRLGCYGARVTFV